MCRDLDPQDGEALADGISEAVAGAGAPLGRALAVSVGRISVPATDARSPDALIARADEAMYVAKRSKA